MTLSEPAATIDGMTNRDDEFAGAPEHIREHARKVRAVQDASRAQEAIEKARAGADLNAHEAEVAEAIGARVADRLRERAEASREAESIRREPFADGWDPGAPTPARDDDDRKRFEAERTREAETTRRLERSLLGALTDDETRNLRLRIVSQLGEAPTVSAELVTDLHAEIERIESFCEKFRRAFGLPPR